MQRRGTRDHSTTSRARLVVDDLFGPPSARPFAVRYWDGTTDAPAGDFEFTLVIRRPGSLRRMLLPPSELSIAESYLRDDVDVEGDMESAAVIGDLAAKRIASPAAAIRLLRHVMRLPKDGDTTPTDDNRQDDTRAARRLFRFGRTHSERRDAESVRFHYDVGNDFYALWLDRQMVYSCAYFERGDEDLDTAQVAKLEYVCRKLRLQPGQRLLDIGCGWGALVLHAARHYGVRATGITLSPPQAQLAREQVAAAKLEHLVTIEVRDYRALGESERFDRIASVGMVEHVGAKRLPEYFAAAYRVLAPGGLFLNHGIVTLEGVRARGWVDPIWRRLWGRDQFIRRYVFPDGVLVPSAAVIRSAEGAGFELRDVESLREHYVTTLRHWVRRLESRAADARAIAGEFTYRVWRLYMSAAAYGFRIGRIGVIQSLFAKADATGRAALPRTRSELYGSPTGSSLTRARAKVHSAS